MPLIINRGWKRKRPLYLRRFILGPLLYNYAFFSMRIIRLIRPIPPFFFSSPWQPHTFAFRIFSIHLPSLIFAVRELRSSFVSSRLINQDKIFIAKFQSWLPFYWLIESWRNLEGEKLFRHADDFARFLIFCKCILFCFTLL